MVFEKKFKTTNVKTTSLYIQWSGKEDLPDNKVIKMNILSLQFENEQHHCSQLVGFMSPTFTVSLNILYRYCKLLSTQKRHISIVFLLHAMYRTLKFVI